jgi:hypothetical protein
MIAVARVATMKQGDSLGHRHFKGIGGNPSSARLRRASYSDVIESNLETSKLLERP